MEADATINAAQKILGKVLGGILHSRHCAPLTQFPSLDNITGEKRRPPSQPVFKYSVEFWFGHADSRRSS